MKKHLISFLLAIILILSGCQAPNGQSIDPYDTAESPSTNQSDHTDTDDNGLCDECGISVIAVFDFYAINDLHGKVCDTDTQPGVDELTTYLKNAYRTDDNVILLSSGDMWQGSSESNLTQGFFVTEWMNELDFVSMTLGNHEYDWGEEVIESNEDLAEFPFLAINIYDSRTNRLVDYCQPSVMVEEDGVRIGIIGAMGDCYSSISGDKVEDIYFKVGRELTSLVKAESEKLRAQGADFIVYSLHDGYGSSDRDGTTQITSREMSSYYDILLSDGYVDLVFEGHTHQHYVLRDEHGVYHLQNGGDNKGISHVEAEINFANGNSRVNTAEIVSASTYGALEDDPIVEELMEKYEGQISVGSQVVGTNRLYRNGYVMRSLVAQLYCEAGLERWGEQYDIVLGGGFISIRSPGYLSEGDVTYAQLQALFPFDNTLVLCSVKGSDLLSRFIHTSNSNYYVHYSDYGVSVKDNIDPNATYYIIVDTYCSSYAPNRLTVVETYTADVYARDLLASYIQAGGLAS